MVGGDKLLVDFGNILSRYTRETDVVGRWGGGEEFLIVCPKTKSDEVIELAKKLKRRIEDAKFEKVGKKNCKFWSIYISRQFFRKPNRKS